jgi:hypothetical protein
MTLRVAIASTRYLEPDQGRGKLTVIACAVS